MTDPAQVAAIAKATVLYIDEAANEHLRALCAKSPWFAIRQYFDGANWMVDYEIDRTHLQETDNGQ